ncbi:antirestriction protein [Janthinobacterium sp. BJB304]|uniref:antirestriction protein n=1 Tax=Janthinobacterium sp. BJB304 TaxID=1572871 RepID=UPI0015D49903|nr:antirestriction protein [Janthinobacterium sp. BJB304]
MEMNANTQLYDNNICPIGAVLVTDVDERMECLPNVAGMRCVLLEFTVYSMLGRMSQDYAGGYWDFYKLSNGGFYMAPQTDGTFRMRCENMFEAEVNAQTAGLIACAMAYSHLSFSEEAGCFGEAYMLLWQYLAQQPNAATIFAALD